MCFKKSKKIQYFRRLFLFLMSFTMVIVLSCTNKITKQISNDPHTINPNNVPVVNITNFSNALKCMDILLKENCNKDIFIYAEDIPNKSGIPGISESAKEMLISTIATMAQESKKLKFVAFDKEMPLLNQLYTKAVSKKFKLPEYFIRGAITQVEKDIEKMGNDFGISASQIASLDSGKTDSMSVIALDMSIGEVSTMQILPGVTSHNVISIYNKDKAYGVIGALIGKGDFSYSLSFRKREGMSAAIRTLIEMGTVELIGKLLKSQGKNMHFEKCLSPESCNDIITNNHSNPKFKNTEKMVEHLINVMRPYQKRKLCAM